MKFPTIVLSCLLVSVCAANAQSADDVKRDIMAALSMPLPITIIGPLITNDVRITQQGDSFLAELDNPLIMGIVPIGPLSFTITPQDNGAIYRVTDFTIPAKVDVFNMATLAIGSIDMDGLWSPESRSYQSLAFKLNDMEIRPKDMEGARVSAGLVDLQVDKEGQSGATESRFSLAASDVVSEGISKDNFRISRMAADLIADGKEPVDLYAVVSRFVILSAMQQDQSQLLQFAESFRAKSYDSVSLGFGIDKLQVQSRDREADTSLVVGRLSGTAAIADMSPLEWGRLAFDISAVDILDKGYSGDQIVKFADAKASIAGTQIPIGATLNATSRLRQIANGETVRMNATDLLDGFLNFENLSVRSKANRISVRPFDKDDKSFVTIGSYDTGFGLQGFRESQGKAFMEFALNDLDYQREESESLIHRQITKTLSPKSVRYDVTISELNEDLLRALAADLVISTQDDLAGLAVPGLTYLMAMNPVAETKNARFVSDEINASVSGKVRLYPAWVLSALAYEGNSRISLSGYDNLVRLLQDIEASPLPLGESASFDKASISILKGLLSTMKAVSKADGDSMVWDVVYPKAREPLVKVNDVVLRFPDFASYLPLFAAGIGGL